MCTFAARAGSTGPPRGCGRTRPGSPPPARASSAIARWPVPVERLPGVQLGPRGAAGGAGPEGSEEELKRGLLLTRLDRAVSWARKQSMWPVTFGLACCAIEVMTTGTSKYDLARWGMELFRASPRQSDLMIVAGRVSQKMAPVLRTIY